MKRYVILLFFILPFLVAGQPNKEKVILIGIDAMSTDGFQNAQVPNMMGLVLNGALSLTTRGVMPTESSPNWESVLCGAGPEQTGVTKSGWTINNFNFPPAIVDKDGFYPSVFKVIRDQIPKAKTGLFYDWQDLGDLINLKYISKVELAANAEGVFTPAITYIVQDSPDFVFIFTRAVGQTSLEKGHGSQEYYRSIGDVDQLIGRLVNSLKKAGLYDKYDIMVVADHGGIGFSHGGESLAEIEVPWIVSGPGIIKDRLLGQPNDLVNTAPTILYLMGLKQPDEWIGKPVMAAIEGTDASRWNNKIYIPQPVPSIKSGIYVEDQTLSFSSVLDNVEIRYTINGKDPNVKSPLFKNPIMINKNTVVKAASFSGPNESEVTTVNITRLTGIKGITMKDPPSARYQAQGPLSLMDGDQGTADMKDLAWMGFEGKNLEAVVDFGNPRKISQLTLSCLLSEKSRVYLPSKVEFYKSDNGINFTLISEGAEKSMQASKKEGSHQFVASFPEIKTRYLKVKAYNIGTCPPESPDAGEKAWLFVDELQVK